jgi:teichuronic acid biosynthesis glycosyltransferase TuaC
MPPRGGEHRLRILTFTSLFPNASQATLGIFIYQRVAHLARRAGNAVIVVAPVPYFPRWLRWGRWKRFGRIPAMERIADLTVYHPRYFLVPRISMPLQGLSMFLGSLRLVRRLQEQMQFDCVDAHYVYPDGFAGMLLARFLRVPFVVSARGTDVNLFPSFRIIRPMIRRTLHGAAGIIAVSAALKEAMVTLGVPRERIRVIGNGVDAERFHPVDRGEARRALGLPENGQIIVSVGGLAHHKGFHLLIQAVAALVPRYPNLKAYVVGEGGSRAELEALARRAEVQGSLFLIGSRPNEELRLWYSAADLSCLLSSREGWPNVLLESLACGTPVVATRVGGIPEVLTSPDLGILVEGEVSAIAAALEIALGKPWDREAMVRYARARTWDGVARELEQFLASCIAGRADR